MDRGLVKESPERRRYPGKDIICGYRVTAISYKSFRAGERPKVCDVATLKEYTTGCTLHTGCFGHMCRASSGSLLPPQSMVVRVGPIATQFAQASAYAFQGDVDTYISKLTETCLTKRGHMRQAMSTPVAGSARLVAVPQVTYPEHYVCISQELARSLRFEYVDVYPSGARSRTSRWKSLEEGDWCILIRPPSLTVGAFQPVQVKFWDQPAIGVHTALFTQVHGDYDGDELHLHVLGDPDSIAEAKAWKHRTPPSFEEGRRLFKTLGIDEVFQTDADLAFMRTTTLSSRQLASGDSNILLGKYTRNPKHHIDAIRSRFHNPDTERNFVLQSIRGTGDIMRQQLSQSSIGEMSRIARIASGCFTRDPEGRLICSTRTGIRHLGGLVHLDSGVPAVRAIMGICSVAQQALLDSHRPGLSEAHGQTGTAENITVRGPDLIANLIRGSQIDSETLDSHTLCVFEPDTKLPPDTLWSMALEDRLLGYVPVGALDTRHHARCLGTYSPRVLRELPLDGRVSIASLAIEFICTYYSIELSDIELHDLACCVSYRPDLSDYPTTTRTGMTERDLSWVDVMQATDFNKIPSLEGGTTYPVTSTSAMYMANFNELRKKHD